MQPNYNAFSYFILIATRRRRTGTTRHIYNINSHGEEEAVHRQEDRHGLPRRPPLSAGRRYRGHRRDPQRLRPHAQSGKRRPRNGGRIVVVVVVVVALLRVCGGFDWGGEEKGQGRELPRPRGARRRGRPARRHRQNLRQIHPPHRQVRRLRPRLVQRSRRASVRGGGRARRPRRTADGRVEERARRGSRRGHGRPGGGSHARLDRAHGRLHGGGRGRGDVRGFRRRRLRGAGRRFLPDRESGGGGRRGRGG